jgi:shikimate dehydrogenase
VDAPYAPPGGETALSVAAAQGGAARVVGGLDLLARQAVAQARLFLPDAFSDAGSLERVVRLAIRPRTNLVLVGLRGAGKTVVGRAVARRLGRPFVDLDEEVLRATGRTAGEWIRASGLSAFREAEREAVLRLGGRRGLVVAAGGGVLETEGNAALLREAAFGVWLQVAPEVAVARCLAERTDRPPLVAGATPREEAESLLRRRAPAWISFARETVPTDGTVEEVASLVQEAWIGHAP